MRYRINPLFWELLNAAGVSQYDLAQHRKHGYQFIWRLKQNPERTVPKSFIDAAVALFPPTWNDVVRGMFEAVPNSRRWRILEPLWQVIILRGIKYNHLCKQIGMSHQRMSVLRHNPRATIDTRTMDALAEELGIEPQEMESYFVAAEIRTYGSPVESALIAS